MNNYQLQKLTFQLQTTQALHSLSLEKIYQTIIVKNTFIIQQVLPILFDVGLQVMWPNLLLITPPYLKKIEHVYINNPVIGASLSEPHIDRDNVPRRGESMYVAACSVCRLNVPENTPIQSITRSARAD